jgi:predicted acylesterase/phospholipase RssA
MPHHSAHLEVLEKERAKFREKLGPGALDLWPAAARRIAVVLSGGGARGAYEAGVLLAFQDARLPTHILASTSIGSINAASYAAHSDGLVGNAEHLVRSWCEVSPRAVGIDWSRYVLMLAGFVAATAGFANLLWLWLKGRDSYLQLHAPMLTWLALGLAGSAITLFYDQIPYLFHVLVDRLRGGSWRPDPGKALRSLLTNLLAAGFLALLVDSVYVQLAARFFGSETAARALLTLAPPTLVLLWFIFRGRTSWLSHKLLRLPLRTGLFPNFERARFLRERIPAELLRASPIRLVMSAADLRTGEQAFLTNTPRFLLASDPGTDPAFVQTEVHEMDDLLQAVIASSAFPLVYEVVEKDDRLWTDGGIVGNQPIRPAIRLGADVLFLVLVEPRSETAGEIKTFLDVGVRAIDILVSQNLKSDLHVLSKTNQICERYARQLKVRPEAVVLELGSRRYRYLKAFTIAPSEPLAATVLDFDADITTPAVLVGYGDGCRAVEQLRDYLRHAPPPVPRYRLRLTAEELHNPAATPSP